MLAAGVLVAVLFSARSAHANDDKPQELSSDAALMYETLKRERPSRAEDEQIDRALDRAKKEAEHKRVIVVEPPWKDPWADQQEDERVPAPVPVPAPVAAPAPVAEGDLRLAWQEAAAAKAQAAEANQQAAEARAAARRAEVLARRAQMSAARCACGKKAVAQKRRRHPPLPRASGTLGVGSSDVPAAEQSRPRRRRHKRRKVVRPRAVVAPESPAVMPNNPAPETHPPDTSPDAPPDAPPAAVRRHPRGIIVVPIEKPFSTDADR